VERVFPLRRIEARIRTVAAAIGAVIAVAIPAGYFVDAYFAASSARTYEAGLAADALSRYAYIQGPAWRINTERLEEIVDFAEARDALTRKKVYDENGDLVIGVGPQPDGPTVSGRADIVVGTAIIGHAEIESSLWEILSNTAIAGALGLILGFVSDFAVHHFPVQALHRAMEQLRLINARLEEQVAETRLAYDELQKQHRLAEETAHELSHAIERVQLASRTKSEFLANMSHELRTPLNAIIGFSEIIKDQTFGPGHASYREYATDIHDSGCHLLRIINDILDIAKIEAGKLDLRHSELDVQGVIDGCHRLMRERAIGAGVTLTCETRGELPTIFGDATKLKQILLNPLANSVKFTPCGGVVALTVFRASDDRVAFEVRDTGIGMSAEDMPVALQPFRQIDNSHTRRYAGTGLGLPLAKVLTELHGGELLIDSELGRGTVITVLLPAASSAWRRLA